MRIALPLLALALCACGREPSFDERFSESEKVIEERAQELDNELNDATGGSNDGSEVQPE